jgi:drug/metabolite transporter (DMT)-like permease
VASPPRSAYLAWGAICVIWGTTYLAIKLALDTLPPFLMGGLRYTFAGGVLAAYLLATRRRLPSRSEWQSFALIGFLMLGFGNGGVVLAEQWVPSGLAAVVIATSPFWMVGVDAVLPGGERLRARQLWGLAIGFLGIVILVGPDLVAATGGRRGTIAGVVSLQLACAGWALGTAYSRRKAPHVEPMPAAALQMLFGGAFMLLAGTALGEWPRVRITVGGSLLLLYLSLVGALAGFVAYLHALRHLSVSFVSLYAYVNPVIAVGLGTLLLAEPLGPRMVAAVAVVLLGMAVVSSGPRAPRQERRLADEAFDR